MLAVLLLLCQAFWDTTPPSGWTGIQAQQILGDSPWIRNASTEGNPKSRLRSSMRPASVRVLLLTAQPVAEAEALLRKRKAAPEPEYRLLLREHAGEYVAVAATVPDIDAFSDAAEVKDMLRETMLRIGKRKLRPVAWFPPGPLDGRVVLVFPREVKPGDEVLEFQLYLPIRPDPYWHVEFPLAELRVRGEPEF